MSILNSPVNIGGRQYRYDGKLNNWVGILTSTVYAADLNNPAIEDATQKIIDGVYILKARLCSYNKRGRKYLAEIELSLDDITEIREKTSAIFTWYTELLYAEPDSSDTVGSDVSNVGNNNEEQGENKCQIIQIIHTFLV